MTGTKYVKDKPRVFNVSRTSLKPVLKALFPWVVNSLLSTAHNLFWHKECMFLLDTILFSQKINLGRLMVHEILTCAKRAIESLFFPNLIQFLYEAEEVSRFDEDEVCYPLDPEIYLDV